MRRWRVCSSCARAVWLVSAIFVAGDIAPGDVYRGVSSILDTMSAVPAAVLRNRSVVETEAGRTVLRRGSRQLAKVSMVIVAKGKTPAADMVQTALSLSFFIVFAQ